MVVDVIAAAAAGRLADAVEVAWRRGFRAKLVINFVEKLPHIAAAAVNAAERPH